MMKKAIYFLALPLLLLAFWGFNQNTNSDPRPNFEINLPDTSILKPQEVHKKKAVVVAGIINYNHYRQQKLNDEISSKMYDRYIEALDKGKYYFLKSDVAQFEGYRKRLDDFLAKGEIELAYDIFNILKQRQLERVERNLNILEKDFDFTKDEYLETDRESAGWAENTKDLDKVWEKRLKNEILTLLLTEKPLDECKDIVKKRYERFRKNIHQSNSEDVFDIFINSLSSTYDPYTTYFSPVQSQNFNMDINKSFEGIGARLVTQEDFTEVYEILPGGPAFKSKDLNVKDKIIGVGQGEEGEFTDVIGWRIDDVVSLIRGEKGTVVRLQILPGEAAANAKPKVVRLVRDKIKIEDQSAFKKVISSKQNGKEVKLGVIVIPSFYMDFDEYQSGIKDYKSTTNDVKKLLKELEAENVQGLVIDLRNNGGGLLKEAIDLSSLFIKEGPVVQVRESDGKIEVYKDEDPEKFYTKPLMIMVNTFSASASEIFAGAMQDYNRALIIGEQTFGKGTVQSLIDLQRYIKDEDGALGQLKLTRSKFYRANGSSTQHKGVSPDLVIPSLYEKDEYGESNYDTSLPWDEIASSNFTPENDLNEKVIKYLSDNYEKRKKDDEELVRLFSTIEKIKEIRKNDKISLNKATRESEGEAYEEIQKAYQELFRAVQPGDEPLEEVKDLYLKNGLKILTEMLAYLN